MGSTNIRNYFVICKKREEESVRCCGGLALFFRDTHISNSSNISNVSNISNAGNIGNSSNISNIGNISNAW